MSNVTKKSKTFNKSAFLKKFIRELRSGKYEQIDGKLKGYEEGEYCLWGLGCEIYRQDYNSCEWNNDNELTHLPDDWQEKLFEDTSQSLDDIMEVEESEIPSFISSKLKTNTSGSIRIAPGKTLSTIGLNDEGITFEGLAALLEVYPLVESNQEWNLELGNMTDNMNFLFRKTKLAKTWRQKAIREGSTYEGLLLEEEVSEDEDND